MVGSWGTSGRRGEGGWRVDEGRCGSVGGFWDGGGGSTQTLSEKSKQHMMSWLFSVMGGKSGLGVC